MLTSETAVAVLFALATAVGLSVFTTVVDKLVSSTRAARVARERADDRAGASDIQVTVEGSAASKWEVTDADELPSGVEDPHDDPTRSHADGRTDDSDTAWWPRSAGSRRDMETEVAFQRPRSQEPVSRASDGEDTLKPAEGKQPPPDSPIAYGPRDSTTVKVKVSRPDGELTTEKLASLISSAISMALADEERSSRRRDYLLFLSGNVIGIALFLIGLWVQG